MTSISATVTKGNAWSTHGTAANTSHAPVITESGSDLVINIEFISDGSREYTPFLRLDFGNDGVFVRELKTPETGAGTFNYTFTLRAQTNLGLNGDWQGPTHPLNTTTAISNLSNGYQGAFGNIGSADIDVGYKFVRDDNVLTAPHFSQSNLGKFSFSNMVFKPADSSQLKTAVNAWKTSIWHEGFKYNGTSPGAWDTGLVSNFSGLFNGQFDSGMATFNSSLIGSWNTSNVTTMANMFKKCHAFNQNINTKQVTVNGSTYTAWDVSKVIDMQEMFQYASSFNSPIGNWDTSSVTTFAYFMRSARDFNQNINTKEVTVGGSTYTAWVTSSVESMLGMFWYADSFNSDISSWDTSEVTNFRRMFRDAIAFDQNIKDWNVSSGQDFNEMFRNTASLSDENKNLACGQYWSANNMFTATTYYADFKAASGCDPYVMTLYGELYKLDNITGVCRMIQGTVEGKSFIINAMMKLDSTSKEEDMNDWAAENASGLTTTKLERQSFYTHVFVKHGDSECIVDLENGKVHGTAKTELVIKPIIGNKCEIPMYNKEVCNEGCSIKAGPVVVYAKMFPNKQVRSEIAIQGGHLINNADGFAVRPMRTKVCRVKKLTDSNLLTMKKSSYKGVSKERFYSTDNKKGVVRSIPKV